MANIDDFKANLIGGGARANQFRVTISPPPGIAISPRVEAGKLVAVQRNEVLRVSNPISIPEGGVIVT